MADYRVFEGYVTTKHCGKATEHDRHVWHQLHLGPMLCTGNHLAAPEGAENDMRSPACRAVGEHVAEDCPDAQPPEGAEEGAGRCYVGGNLVSETHTTNTADGPCVVCGRDGAEEGAAGEGTLAEVLNLSPLRCTCGREQHDFCGTCVARYLLASDWLAAHTAAAVRAAEVRGVEETIASARIRDEAVAAAENAMVDRAADMLAEERAKAQVAEAAVAALAEQVEAVPDWLSANGMDPQEVAFVRAQLRAVLPDRANKEAGR